MGVEERIPAMKDEMIGFLQKIIRIPSVRSEERQPGAPFGPELARILSEVLAWGETEGFRVKNIGGYAGHIEYGSGEECLGVQGHLDVVPAGDGWTSPPFAGEIRDGQIYGRGTIDDKGPMVAAMYALKALKEAGIPLKRKVRLIVGCDEESNWECMEAYFKEEPKPALGFTPDAEFPLIFCEKGHLSITLTMDHHRESRRSGVRIIGIDGGSRRNIVPDQASATIGVDRTDELESILKKLQQISAFDPLLTIETTSVNEIRIQARGRAAHASMPELGDNALARLMVVLNELEGEGGPWPMVRFLARAVGKESDGTGLGIASSDSVSGALTLNLGVISMNEQSIQTQLDIRYPISAEGDDLADRIEEEAGKDGLTVEMRKVVPPHYVEPDHPLITQLLTAYRDETGDMSPPLAIGGRTYATTMGTAVAFGAVFPGQPELAHQRDEHIGIDDMVKCARIFARALEALAGM